MRVLLADDDPGWRSILAAGLRRQDHYVDCVDNGNEAIARARRTEYDALLLDLGMPGGGGIDACRRLRQARVDVPILVITGSGALTKRVEALDSGADDCMSKPVDLPEVMARLRAVTRRGRTRTLRAIVEHGPLTLDESRRVVTLDGAPLALTATEYRLLAYLMRRAGAIVSREELVHRVWGGHVDGHSNTIEVYISYLRKSLAGAGDIIHTVRGLGYCLECPTGG